MVDIGNLTHAAKALGVAVVISATPLGGTARAGSAVGVTASCPSTGPGVVVCGTIGTILHELVQIGNGKDGFGPNGEIAKILAAPLKIVDGNIKGASRESGEIDKLLRASSGISIRDIKKYGIFGGPNSIFRKPFG
ncbi:hypothetical protein GOB50_31070 [Sinorhizobium meliloti]|nr:hypothetical protein [Sinorhizobium meliloti]MDX1010490.1 hypothetical protein [Sinorhizobium medicae]